MIERTNAGSSLQQCRKHLQRQVSPFDVAGLAAEKEELEKKMGAPDFWDDVEAANKANQRMKTISAKLEKYNRLRGLLEDAEVMADMAEEGDDQEIADELIKDMPNLESKVEALKLETLLKGPYDRLNAILSLHAGAGGTEVRTGYQYCTECTPDTARARAGPSGSWTIWRGTRRA